MWALATALQPACGDATADTQTTTTQGPIAVTDASALADGGASTADAPLSSADAPLSSADAHLPADVSPVQDTQDTLASPDVTPDVAVPPKLGPPYPIVLAHGFFGAESFAGLSFATYFHGVKADLAAHGEPLVFTPAVDPFHDSAQRGAQLLQAVQGVLTQTGHGKVVIVGHSQGGLDARWVAWKRPDLVAGVVTYATPHYGSPVADAAVGVVKWNAVQKLVQALLDLAGKAVWKDAADGSSLAASVSQLTSLAMTQFNQAHPNQPGVQYFSLTGRTALAVAKGPCLPDLPVPFVQKYDQVVDSIDPMLLATKEVIDGGPLKAIAHDGLVRVEDAQWGTFLGCVPADHLDEIGQLLGDKPGLVNPFDHKLLFRDLVAFLRAKGL